jgi:hypothetical protein
MDWQAVTWTKARRVRESRDRINSCREPACATLGSIERNEPVQGNLRVRNTPKGDRTRLAPRSARSIGIKSQLVTADAVADVKRIVEVRHNPDDARIPSLSLVEVGRVMKAATVWACGW